MRVLWVLPYSPWPTTSGGKTRQYNLLRSLSARGHRITLLVQSKQVLTDADRAMIEPLLESLIVVPRRPLRSLTNVWGALFSSVPLLASINGYSRPMEKRLEALLQERWDIVQVEHSYSFQPLEKLLKGRRQPFVLTEHNVESSLGAATYSRFPDWARPFAWFDQWRYRLWERRVLNQAARVVAVTDADASLMQLFSKQPVTVVVNGVDCAHFSTVQPDFTQQRVLFLGNYEYSPNVDAVEWAMDEIMPRLWQQCPKAVVSICGYALPAQWFARWPDERIEWQGFVSDLPALQSSSSVFLAPLRHGGGSKLKVLEALAAGLPLVSTVQGVSGLDVEPGRHYLSGDTAEQLAAALAEVLKTPALAAKLGAAGRGYVREQHDWSVAASQLEAIYADMKRETSRESSCA